VRPPLLLAATLLPSQLVENLLPPLQVVTPQPSQPVVTLLLLLQAVMPPPFRLVGTLLLPLQVVMPPPFQPVVTPPLRRPPLPALTPRRQLPHPQPAVTHPLRPVETLPRVPLPRLLPEVRMRAVTTDLPAVMTPLPPQRRHPMQLRPLPPLLRRATMPPPPASQVEVLVVR
jgi:hypothetical protein